MLDNQEKTEVKPHFDRCYGKRPAYEMYDLKTYPWHMNNLTTRPELADTLSLLKGRLERYLCDMGDPEALVDTLGNLNCDTVWRELPGCMDKAFSGYNGRATVHVQDSCRSPTVHRQARPNGQIRTGISGISLNTDGKHVLEVRDIKGKLLMREPGEGHSHYHLQGLPPGLYLVSVRFTGSDILQTVLYAR